MTVLNLVEEHLNSYNSPYKFNAKELDEETGNYYYGARYYSPKYNLMLSVDPMYHLYPSVSPYAYTLNNPVRYTDPTGMTPEDNPVFGSDGTYRGNTKEGYTGAILIYDGDLDFSQMSAYELEYNTENGATHYDFKRHELSGEAKSKIWTHIASQLEGQQIYDETFSMSDLTGRKIHYDEKIKDSWISSYKLGEGKGRIRGSDKYSYETTVENIQSSIGVHEWYSHIKKKQRDGTKSHRLAYKNVINYKSLWNNTTENYKEFNMWGLREYTWKETGRKTVDKPYLQLSNQYNQLKNKFK
ncbi:RHS repeat-associated core domain-containing protein [Mesonia hippocampi]|uniref:RHS repeat-associated core domain-containing protein n=1 Tax=Mesonia hippocampi TaxID=1628250 RepID=UPI003F9E7D85